MMEIKEMENRNKISAIGVRIRNIAMAESDLNPEVATKALFIAISSLSMLIVQLNEDKEAARTEIEADLKSLLEMCIDEIQSALAAPPH